MTDEQTPAAGPLTVGDRVIAKSDLRKHPDGPVFVAKGDEVQITDHFGINHCIAVVALSDGQTGAWAKACFDRPHVASPASSSSVVQGDGGGVERGESAGDMLSRLGMDGKLWAEEFQKTALTLGYPEMDDGWLLGWFCNAIMAGYDHARRKYDPEILAHFRPQPSGETRDCPHGLHSVGSCSDCSVNRSMDDQPHAPVSRPAGEGERESVAILKGVGKITGDGWKDTTTKGDVVFVWSAERPSPYAPGQYPRIGNEGWSASTSQYDFTPATADDVPAILSLLSPVAPDAGQKAEGK